MCTTVRTLITWYKLQLWYNGIISPFIFVVYVSDLHECLVNHHIWEQVTRKSQIQIFNVFLFIQNKLSLARIWPRTPHSEFIKQMTYQCATVLLLSEKGNRLKLYKFTHLFPNVNLDLCTGFCSYAEIKYSFFKIPCVRSFHQNERLLANNNRALCLYPECMFP